MDPQELKQRISTGLLSFPLTDFKPDGNIDRDGYANRLEWLMPYGATALFAAGGTGEFFSLTSMEYSQVIATAVERCRNRVPLIAGVGGPTPVAVAYAQEADRLRADGILLLPHYLTEAPQAGIKEYVKSVCRAVRCGVIVYNRGISRLAAPTLLELADECPNLIGFKDGIGEIELMVSIRRRLGDRFAYLGGLPTAEIFAPAYKAMGVPVYSSAVFNFIPKTAMTFYHAMAADDTVTVNHLIDQFFLPYIEIRNLRAGYAVSIVKAGARLVGHGAGPVRPPLVDLQADEAERLRILIEGVGNQN